LAWRSDIRTGVLFGDGPCDSLVDCGGCPRLPDRLPSRWPMTPDAAASVAARRSRVPVLQILGLLLFYLYVWLRVDPGLLFYWTRYGLPGFTLGLRHARPFLARPGGAIEYVSAFLFQLYAFSWAGALIMALVAAGICACTHALFRAFGGRCSALIALVPGVLLLVLHGRYAYVLPNALAVLTALAAACAYVRLRRLRAPQRLATFAGLLAATYYLACGAALLYAALCALAELLVRGRRSLSLAMAILGGGLPAPAAIVFNIRFRDAYLRLLPFHPATDERASAALAGLYGFLLLGVCLGYVLRAREAGADRARPVRKAARAMAWVRRSAPLRAVAAAVLVGAATLTVLAGFDSQLNSYLVIGRAARRGEWEEVVRVGRGVDWRPDAFVAALNLNRALCHSGRLLEDMFSFPQSRSGLLMSPVAMVGVAGSSAGALMTFSDILLDLGRVNESEHMALEAFCRVGDRPWVLERLAMMIHNLHSIGELYFATMPWLREEPLCRS